MLSPRFPALRTTLAAAVCCVIAIAAHAQNTLNIYTLNQEAMFAQSAFGQRVRQTIESRSSGIAAENRRIEEELKAEEQALTEQRPTLDPAEFRQLADAFDAKVEEIRTTRAKKSADLSAWTDAERTRFFELAFPVLLDLAKELGASAILDMRTVIIASDQIDITATAQKRVDQALGDGAEGSEP